ncbi:hypothetical protein EC973_004330 [Apophysomyces ossiformis]|uniref:Uncharacterized protein n=1 Tax=Apophysomyces ossiformis TaxID=679940 RepID=A0A8H7EPZ3_9FUNG|nr:hypothetical protein EC973_004330 [Apophysomyces ossiformis]
MVLWFISGDTINDASQTLAGVMQIVREILSYFPFMALLFMRYAYPKPLDDIFMESLRFVDRCHPGRPPYAEVLSRERFRNNYWKSADDFSKGVRAKVRLFVLGVFVLLASGLPKVGPLVLPIAGAYASFHSLGNKQGIVIGACFFFISHHTAMKLLHALVVMRALMRQMFDPYFARMDMNRIDRRRWLQRRKELLFAFSALTYFLTHIPYIAFIGYGISQATAAYMLTTVVDPPQPLSKLRKQTVDELSVSESEMDRKTR